MVKCMRCFVTYEAGGWHKCLPVEPSSAGSPAGTSMEVAEMCAKLRRIGRGLVSVDADCFEAAALIEQQQRQLADVEITDPLLKPPLEHTRSCPQLTPGEDESCTCGLEWRIQLATRIQLHSAWMKRANEAEAESAELERQKASLQDSLDKETDLVIKYGDKAKRAEAECAELRKALESILPLAAPFLLLESDVEKMKSARAALSAKGKG